MVWRFMNFQNDRKNLAVLTFDCPHYITCAWDIAVWAKLQVNAKQSGNEIIFWLRLIFHLVGLLLTPVSMLHLTTSMFKQFYYIVWVCLGGWNDVYVHTRQAITFQDIILYELIGVSAYAYSYRKRIVVSEYYIFAVILFKRMPPTYLFFRYFSWTFYL